MTAMMVGGNAFGGVGGSIGRGGSLSSPTASASHRLPSPRSPPSPVSSESPTSPTSPGRAKACGVCGDIAKSMHFGGLSCDSCKAFFRRSVQNNAHRGFTCPYEKKCVIAVSSRKSCQYCRFQKCLSIGMEKGWVMTEDERRKMMQQRQEKKHKEEEKKKMTLISSEEKYALTEEESTEIEIILSLYKKAYQDVPYQEENPCEGPKAVMSPWMTFCKRIGYFFSLFREFADLPSSDQALLLKSAIPSACIIMGSVVYDTSSGRWGNNLNRCGYVPTVSLTSAQSLVPAELMSRVENFFKKFKEVCPDEKMAMILILVALYSPELMGLQAKDNIQALQDRYTRVLRKYVGWKYKEHSTLMFPKVIVSLADIRELAERTCQMRIKQSMTSNITAMSGIVVRPGSSSATATTSTDVESPMETNEGEEDEDVEGATPMSEGGLGPGCVGVSGMVQVKQECDMQSDSALQTEAAHKRARLEATGGVKDHTYQKIVQKIMDQMHGSSIHMRAPSLLPFIIQIVKKVGSGTGASTSSQASSSHKPSRGHHSKHHHRTSSKRRVVEVKQEHLEEDLDTQDISPLSSNTVSPAMHPSPPPPLHFPPQMQHQHQQQQHHHHLPRSPSLPPSHHFTNSPSHASIYPASPMESTDSCDLLPTSPPHDPIMPSPMHPTSPEMMLPLSGSHMIPVAPYTPPSATPSPSIPHKQPTVLPTTDMPLPSPVAAPSPYSDSSNSSPESSQSPMYDLFSEDLSNVEIDVLTQLLDYVSNFDNLDNVSSLKEILPPHLLSELQTKLCSYSLKQE
ncbi:uncharacterized protein LOC123501468 isoform X2 [Portunus trituberculatus]|uniref:uncharacterized protein LOC123501468 isoform X2 n=1 Tax=Portunus trituberculatus TaxID=210409 RepID=UPI001E1CE763|nr:uncharacterized protein LOC123501468 isoform X2 [Portunus trituberculatus]